MISRYKTVAIIYGGESGKKYADKLRSEIIRVSEEERYPIQPKIIMESILTKELLTGVMELFKESEFCVAFLTEDENAGEEGKKKRLRQNIVFELGMALMQLGRERCMLLSDFDWTSTLFDAPSDMHSLEIRRFYKDDVDEVVGDIITKILQESRESIVSGYKMEVIPQYKDLLIRSDYFIDYENLFVTKVNKTQREHENYFAEILREWSEECLGLIRYDEKSMFLLERLCFLPVFAWSTDIDEFLAKMEREIQIYKQWDVSYYENVEILDFVKNIVRVVIAYTRIKKMQETDFSHYKILLDDILMEAIPLQKNINPLILLVYYDYLGLIYLKLSNYGDRESYAECAKKAFGNALKYVGKVDMSTKIWSGFIFYNMARASMKCKELEEAEFYYKKAIKIRAQWRMLSELNIKIRNILSFEYFVAEITLLEMYEEYGMMSLDLIQKEFEKIESEVDAYIEEENTIDPLIEIKRRLIEHKRGKKN